MWKGISRLASFIVAMLPPEPLTEVGVLVVAATGAGVLPPVVVDEEEHRSPSYLAALFPGRNTLVLR